MGKEEMRAALKGAARVVNSGEVRSVLRNAFPAEIAEALFEEIVQGSIIYNELMEKDFDTVVAYLEADMEDAATWLHDALYRD